MSEQEAGITTGDPENVASNQTDVTAKDVDVDKKADKSVTESAPAETVSGDITTTDNSATDETQSSTAAEANDNEIEQGTAENVESTIPQAEVSQAEVSQAEVLQAEVSQAEVSQAEVTESEDVVVATIAETVSSSVSEPGKTDDSNNETKSVETSADKSQVTTPATGQVAETNAADSTIQSTTPTPVTGVAAVATVNRETAVTETVAAGRTANKATQDVTKMSGNDELKFGVLIGLVRVGQLSNKEVVDSVLSLVSLIMYAFGFISITIHRD
jgi:hypothetical protein